MRPRSYKILAYAIEEGLDCGWNIANQQGNSDPKSIKECLHDTIMAEIEEWFEFDETEVPHKDGNSVDYEEEKV